MFKINQYVIIKNQTDMELELGEITNDIVGKLGRIKSFVGKIPYLNDIHVYHVDIRSDVVMETVSYNRPPQGNTIQKYVSTKHEDYVLSEKQLIAYKEPPQIKRKRFGSMTGNLLTGGV